MANEPVSDYLITYADLVLDEIFKRTNKSLPSHLLNVTIVNALEIMKGKAAEFLCNQNRIPFEVRNIYYADTYRVAIKYFQCDRRQMLIRITASFKYMNVANHC